MNLTRRLWLLPLVGFLFDWSAVSLSAEETAKTQPERQIVTLKVHGETLPMKTKGIAKWYGPGAVDEVTFEVSTDQLTSLELMPGPWVLEASLAGYWSKKSQVVIGSPTPESAILELWPIGWISGGFQEPRDRDELPETLFVYSRPAPGQIAASQPPSARVECEVKKSSWRCGLPVGRHDLRFHSSGYVPRYRWGVEIEPDKTVLLGQMSLARGASVAGWIETVDGSELTEKAEVKLRPRIGRPVNRTEETQRIGRMSHTAPVNSRGFFHIDDVPPGEYVLEARQSPFAPTTVSVQVVAGEVTQVADPPLLLDYAKTLEISINPPVDPWGRPWQTSITMLDRGSSILTILEQGVAAADGIWRKEALPSGRYQLTIRSQNDASWWSEEIEVFDSPTFFPITIPLVKFAGTVRLGKKPLSAELWFGGRYGSVKVALTSDETGFFSGTLPHPGDWKLEVFAEDPEVRRSLTKVEVRPSKQRDIAQVDIRLPSTELRGRVVDEQGEPIVNAIVSFKGENLEYVQERTDELGEFVIHGLEPGATEVIADAGYDRYSDRVVVEVIEERSLTPLELIAREQIRVRGTVVSSSGPVVGARIKATPLVQRYLSIRTVTSDKDGQFEVIVPPGTREMRVTAGAPGFAFRMFRAPIPDDRSLTIGLEQVHGTLAVELDQPIDWHKPLRAQIWIFHRDSFEGLAHLLNWAMTAGARNDGATRLTIPQLEPGDYTLCRVQSEEVRGLDFGVLPDGRCTSITLPPSGTVQVRAPAVGGEEHAEMQFP